MKTLTVTQLEKKYKQLLKDATGKDAVKSIIASAILENFENMHDFIIYMQS